MSTLTLKRHNAGSALSASTRGMMLGLAAVMCFAFTLPLTRYVTHYIDPWFLGVSRALMAAPLAALLLWAGGATLLTRQQWVLAGLSAIGVTLGFPLCIALAMSLTEASRGGVVIGLLPLATAVIGTVLSRDRMPKRFWAIALIGAVLMLIYTSFDQQLGWQWGDLILLLSVLLGGLGYATGGMLAKQIPAWQAICWTVVIGAPFLVVPSLYFLPESLPEVPVSGWLSLAYLVVVSQLCGFFLWNKGLALGGIARVSQTQLLQPFFTLLIAVIFFQEQVGVVTVVFAMLIVGVVAAARCVTAKR